MSGCRSTHDSYVLFDTFVAIFRQTLNLFSLANCSEAHGPISVPVVTFDVHVPLSGQCHAVSAHNSAQPKPSSKSLVRSVETEMPTLMDDSSPTWVEHVLAYIRAASWGSGDVPAVLTDDLHENSQGGRNFFWPKMPTVWRQRCNWKTSKLLLHQINGTAAVTAKQNRDLHMEALLGICAHIDESVTQFSVVFMKLREKVIIGGGAMDDATLLWLIIRRLPVRLSAARDDVNKRDMDLHTAMAYLHRAGNLAVIANGATDHSAMVSYQHHTNATITTSTASIANRSPTWTLLNGQNVLCKRCGV